MAIFAQDNSSNYIVNMTSKLIKPPYLQHGDTIAIVAPSGILNNRNTEVDAAVKLLNSWGLCAVIGKNVYKKSGHFAGTDAQRAADFQWALDDPKIKAIWCARGGYGTVRVLDLLDYTKFVANPKWVIGYSDITGIHNQIHTKGVESIHAMMCTSLGSKREDLTETIATFKTAIFGKELQYTIKGSAANKTGTTTGQLVGGNLTLLHTMLGSNTSIDMTGKILFFEEIGEYAYHIDRMLQSLKRAGYFKNCKGIIVGDITRVRKNTTPFGKTVEQLILDVVAEYDFPVAFGFPAGHKKENNALILGREVKLTVTKSKTTVLF